MAFVTHEQNELLWYGSSLLEGRPGVAHGFSTRKGGVSRAPWDTLNLGVGRKDDPEDVRENYRRFCGALGLDQARTVLSRQVHGTAVRVCTEADAGKGLYAERDFLADGLVTNVPGLALTVFSADCGVILLYDPESACVGAVHAGWRGCAAGILEETVRTMGTAYGARPETILAAVGPCIGQCCFETDGDVPAAMKDALGADAEPYLERRREKWHVDLAGLNRQWLLHAGVPAGNIDVSGVCTACRTDLLWSYRRMGDQRGAQAAMIALRETL